MRAITAKEIMYAKKGFAKAASKAYGEAHGLTNFMWNSVCPDHRDDEKLDIWNDHVRTSRRIHDQIINDPQYNHLWECKAMINRIKKSLTNKIKAYETSK